MIRKQHTGEPGNGGQFGTHTRADGDVALAGVFVFDKDYDNHEQVRPFQDAYNTRRAELEAASQYPYNDSFKGHIPGIEGPHEDKAIYMLQKLRSIEEMQANIDAFIAGGGREISVDELADGAVLRGTVVHAAFYSGGTGYMQWEGARLMLAPNGRQIAMMEKGKRAYGHILGNPGRVFYRP